MKDQSSPFIQFIRRYWPLLVAAALVLWALNRSGDVTFMNLREESMMDYGKGGSSVMYDAMNYAVPEADYAVGAEMMRSETADMMVDGAFAEQKVIQTSSLSLHVEDVRKSVDEITNMVGEWEGFVINTNVSRGEDAYYGWLSLRVPSDRFDVAMQSLKDLSLYVNSEYTDASDVTETYMDLDARLKNLKAEEEQYLGILDTAVTVEEVLQVTQALSNVRYQIDSIQSQLNYYDTRVDYSTIDVSLTEDSSVSAVTDTWRPLGTLKQAFSDWVVWLQDVADRVIQGLVFGWPLLVLLILVMVFRKRK